MLGDDETDDASLVAQIRRQPFGVVLLDEIEKAEPSVWDLFLQVFDAGRLSDPRGSVADFRHAVIIMTSNLGREGRGPGRGSASRRRRRVRGRAGPGGDEGVPPEFLNRIDRAVVFRPLTRPMMRGILAGELGRCWRGAGCATASGRSSSTTRRSSSCWRRASRSDLGARPLKRAVERHFLAPLALAIAAHDVPGGDQFLFVRAGTTGLKVASVDPDASEPAGVAPGEPVTLRTLAREGKGFARPARGGVPRGLRRACRATAGFGAEGRAAGAHGRARVLGGRRPHRGARRGSSCATGSSPACAARTR